MVKLEKGEHIEHAIRRHWFVMLFPIISSIILIVIPLLSLWFFVRFEPLVEFFGQISFSAEVGWAASAFYLVWLVLVLVFLFVQWTEYYLDVWLVTNRRLIDVNQHSVFNRSVKSLRFERVQDITVEVRGILATLLRFGDVHVQTAGATREIIIKQVREPYSLRKIILGSHDKATENFYGVHKNKTPASKVLGGKDGI